MSQSCNICKWFLCGLATECVLLFRVPGEVADTAHHRVTIEPLSPNGELRPLLEQYIAGSPLADLPALESEVAKLSFTPIVERIIEARASNIRHALRDHKIKAGKGASLGLWLPELFNEIASRPAHLDRFMVLAGVQHDSGCL